MKRLIYLKNWQSLDLLVSPLKKLSSHDFYSLRHTSIVTSRHSLMIAAVTVRVNNHCPAFLKLVAIYSWLPNNCLCIERCSSQQCEKNVLEIVQSQRTVLKSWQFYSLVFRKAEDVLISVYGYIFKIVIEFFLIFYSFWFFISGST